MRGKEKPKEAALGRKSRDGSEGPDKLFLDLGSSVPIGHLSNFSASRGQERKGPPPQTMSRIFSQTLADSDCKFPYVSYEGDVAPVNGPFSHGSFLHLLKFGPCGRIFFRIFPILPPPGFS